MANFVSPFEKWGCRRCHLWLSWHYSGCKTKQMKQINVFLTWFWKISHIFKWNTRKDKVTNKQKRVKSLVALFCNLFWFLENTYDKTKIVSYLLRTYCIYVFHVGPHWKFDFRAKTLHKCIPILYTAISMTSLVEQSLVQPSDHVQ